MTAPASLGEVPNQCSNENAGDCTRLTSSLPPAKSGCQPMPEAPSKADLLREIEETVEQERAVFEKSEKPTRKYILDALATEEAGDGDLFALLYRGLRCYDYDASKWYTWAGHHWAEHPGKAALDDVATVADLYRQLSFDVDKEAVTAAGAGDKDAGKQAEKLRDGLRKRAGMLCKKQRREAVLVFAGTPMRLGVSGDIWDAKPRLLGCLNGVLELLLDAPYIRFRDGRPDDKIRAVAPTSWAGIDAPAPRVTRFLSEVFGGDLEIVDFLVRVIGYALAGDPVEHIFLICYGPGRNGKSTLFEMLREVFGPCLVGPCDTETILRGRDRGAGAASPDLFMLRGLRLAIARESKEGRRMDEAVVKALSGGDTITARALNEMPVSFRPSFTLLQLTNHKPQIDAEDAAIWMRVVLLPFLQTFVTNPDDMASACTIPARKNMLEEMRSEGAGVLALAARGWVEYRRLGGLCPPKVVQAAKRTYREAEDVEGRFIADCCDLDPGALVMTSALKLAFEKWCDETGHAGLGRWNRMAKRLEEKFEKLKRRGGGIPYRGLTLKQPAREE